MQNEFREKESIMECSKEGEIYRKVGIDPGSMKDARTGELGWLISELLKA